MTRYECFVVDHIHRTLSRKAGSEADEIRSYAHEQVNRGLTALVYVNSRLDAVLIPDDIRLSAQRWA